ncbi:hypothetical protein [Dyadobacter sp. 676]|uniref:Uncharacterized protein n=1 Tax=Dyadobacter sp. 676 TaxID=3088362 RepID=A0AAU8FFX7_9BACT
MSYIAIKGTTSTLKQPFEFNQSRWHSKMRMFTGEGSEKQNAKLAEIENRYAKIYRDLWPHGPVTPAELITAYLQEFSGKIKQEKVPSRKEAPILAEIEALKRDKPVNLRRRIALYEERLDALTDRLAKLKRKGEFQDIEGLLENTVQQTTSFRGRLTSNPHSSILCNSLTKERFGGQS